MGHTQNQSKPFLTEIKKQIISFQKPFILSRYHMLKAESIYLFWLKTVILTPGKTTVGASQLYLLDVKQ